MQRRIQLLLAAALLLLLIFALRDATQKSTAPAQLESHSSQQQQQQWPQQQYQPLQQQNSANTSSAKAGGISQTPGYSELQHLINTVNIDNITYAEAENLYYTLMEQLHVKCPVSKRIGRQDDGGWDVCFAPPFDIRSSSRCTVFSYGVADIYEFDDIMATEYKCNVYMYDPSMKKSDHQRTNSSWFFNTGVSSENTVQPNGWKVRTVCRTFEDNGFADKVIDVLKMDIEHAEWSSLEKAVQDGCLRRVKQLMFESHATRLKDGSFDFRRFLRVLFGIFRLGFRTWKWHLNTWGSYFVGQQTKKKRAFCYEHYLVNTALLPAHSQGTR